MLYLLPRPTKIEQCCQCGGILLVAYFPMACHTCSHNGTVLYCNKWQFFLVKIIGGGVTGESMGRVNNYYVLKSSICGMSSASHLCSSGQFRPVLTGCNHAIAFLRIIIYTDQRAHLHHFSSIRVEFVVTRTEYS